jgi:hypothetical protein
MLLPHWVFENVVVVSFQITFRVKMYQNDFFFIFLKIIFEISTSKRSKTYKKILIFCKKKIKIFENAVRGMFKLQFFPCMVKKFGLMKVTHV